MSSGLHRRSNGRRIARALSWTAVTLSVLLLIGTLGGVLLVRHYEGQLTRIGLAPSKVVASAGPLQQGVQNILLVGSDTRAGVGKGFGSALKTVGQRSDTVILAHFPKGDARPTLVSFPRDAYVTIPAYRDAQQVEHAEHRDKLNAAFNLGGPALLVSTIEQLSGLPVDHYVEVNFAGFQQTVDALGGVTLCARTTRNDPATGPSGGSDDFMTAGVHENVSGAVALAFVRDRHSFPNGDIARIQDQQHFIAQLMKKAISRGTLTNPQRLNGFLTSVAKSLRVDNNLSLGDMQDLAFRLRKADPAHVTFVTLPFSNENGTAYINGLRASVVIVDEQAAQALFARLRGLTVGPQTTSPGPTLTARPSRSPSSSPSSVGTTGDQLSCGA